MIKLVAARAAKKLPPLQIRARKLLAMDTTVRGFMKPLVLIVQLNCPTAADSRAIRQELAACGCSMAIVKGSILRLILRNDAHLARLTTCVVGMTAIICTRKPPAEISQPLGDIIRRFSASNLMYLAGGALMGRAPLSSEGVLGTLREIGAVRESLRCASDSFRLPAFHVLAQLASPASAIANLLDRYIAQQKSATISD